jgi:hypothetical protein
MAATSMPSPKDPAKRNMILRSVSLKEALIDSKKLVIAKAPVSPESVRMMPHRITVNHS